MPNPPQRKRLNGYISARSHKNVKEILDAYDIPMSEGLRHGINLFVAVMPTLARGGKLVLREPDGTEEVYMYPFFS